MGVSWGLVTIQAVEQGNLVTSRARSRCAARLPQPQLGRRARYPARLRRHLRRSAWRGDSWGAAGLPKNSTFTPTDLASALNTASRPRRKGSGASRNSSRDEIRETSSERHGLRHLRHEQPGPRPAEALCNVGTGNEYVDYGNDLINASIARAPEPGCRNKLGSSTRPQATRAERRSSRSTPTRTGSFSSRTRASTPRSPIHDFTAAVVRRSLPRIAVHDRRNRGGVGIAAGLAHGGPSRHRPPYSSCAPRC